jgi:hypothetical protein
MAGSARLAEELKVTASWPSLFFGMRLRAALRSLNPT